RSFTCSGPLPPATTRSSSCRSASLTMSALAASPSTISLRSCRRTAIVPPVFSRNADGDEASEEDSRQHSARSEHIQRVDWKVRLHRVGDERADEKSAQNGREHHNA